MLTPNQITFANILPWTGVVKSNGYNIMDADLIDLDDSSSNFNRHVYLVKFPDGVEAILYRIDNGTFDVGETRMTFNTSQWLFHGE